MNMQELLLELHSDVRVEKLFREILKHRPSVPVHNFKIDNTEEWKARSAEQRGFDIWLAHLNINLESPQWKK
jgi:hypothetical protein